MTIWTEAAIAAALEGRFYGLDGKCRYEERERRDREKREAAIATREQAAEVVKLKISEEGITAGGIIAAVAHAHRVGPADITGRRRPRHIIHARQHACALIRELTGLSFQHIADAIGLVDHSTVHHSCVAWAKRGHVYAAEDRKAREVLGLQQRAAA